ncbi:hypothetical protein D3C84_330540 [compost metagenome]
MHVGDRIDRTVEQQLAALFCLAQGYFGGAPGAAFLEVGQFAFGHQHQALVFALRQRVLGPQGQGFGDAVGVIVGEQLDDGDIFGLAANRVDCLAWLEVFAAGGADQQIPAVLQGLAQVIAGDQPMHARGAAGVAEQADETLGLVLRVFENQQSNGFFFDGHIRSQICGERA